MRSASAQTLVGGALVVFLSAAYYAFSLNAGFTANDFIARRTVRPPF